MNSPKVSIVTPSFQQGDFIEETLISVANQSYQNIEHIVIDGGSTDDTLEILEEYENKYSVRWVSEPDEGQSDAINKGFDLATGDIVGWLNSDDFYYDSDVVETAVDWFTSDRDLDVLYGTIAHVDKDSHIQRFQPVPSFDFTVLQKYNYIPQPGVFFDSSVVSQQKLRRDYVFAMDYEYWLRLASSGCKFRSTSRVMAAYRIHDEAKGPSLGLEDLYKEREEIQSDFKNSLPIKILYFKLERKLRELIMNLELRQDLGSLPPILHGGE